MDPEPPQVDTGLFPTTLLDHPERHFISFFLRYRCAPPPLSNGTDPDRRLTWQSTDTALVLPAPPARSFRTFLPHARNSWPTMDVYVEDCTDNVVLRIHALCQLDPSSAYVFANMEPQELNSCMLLFRVTEGMEYDTDIKPQFGFSRLGMCCIVVRSCCRSPLHCIVWLVPATSSTVVYQVPHVGIIQAFGPATLSMRSPSPPAFIYRSSSLLKPLFGRTRMLLHSLSTSASTLVPHRRFCMHSYISCRSPRSHFSPWIEEASIWHSGI